MRSMSLYSFMVSLIKYFKETASIREDSLADWIASGKQGTHPSFHPHELRLHPVCCHSTF